MARRTTKAEATGLLLLVIIGVPIYITVKFFETYGYVGPTIGLIGVGAIVFAIRAMESKQREAATNKRRADLFAKYNDQQTVDRIIAKTVWVGETSEQLIESLGRPPDIDEKAMKTKRKEIWKYAHKGGNRYGLRITVENNEVVGWDERL